MDTKKNLRKIMKKIRDEYAMHDLDFTKAHFIIALCKVPIEISKSDKFFLTGKK